MHSMLRRVAWEISCRLRRISARLGSAMSEAHVTLSVTCVQGGMPHRLWAHRYERLVAALSDPRDSEHLELRRWVGNWDPEHVDLGGINRRLARLPVSSMR